MTYDEYQAIESDLLEAYRVGDILTEEELEDEMEALQNQWEEEGEQ